MGKITITETIDAPVDAVFAYVDDYRNTTKYMKDLVKWKPTTNVTHGKGAQFESGMKAGPSTLTSTVDITTWTENRTIGWKSIAGFKQTGKWSFKALGGETEATFDMEYEFGGGIAGRMLGRAAEPIVRSNLQQSVRNLKTQTEKLKGKSGAKAPAKKTASRSRS
ncbi:MAG: SRPBCC family protein [Candidatus Dormibacteraeota bacterium]|nr:SRPBCC family protein [Candidatus Dormibacteraeota bacterium]